MIYKTLIVGFGEIGKSLCKVLKKQHSVEIVDINVEPNTSNVDVMHICFPYSKNFIKEVKRYRKKYNPKYVVIHSTVKIGTSKKCDAYYSPVRGIHPLLEKSLKTFVKYLAPRSKYFKLAGISVEEHDSRETLETMKLYCTTLYGLNIIAEKEIYNFCKKHDVDFDVVYTKSNKTYNEGYKDLGFAQYTRYNLKHFDGKIGGHCVIPNCKLLKTSMARYILKENHKL